MAAAMALAVALTGCSPKTTQGGSASSGSQQGPFVFTRENLPRLDGSTSTVPLAKAMCAVLLGETTEQVSDLVDFSRTTQSYRNLMAGERDLVLAAEPEGEVLAQLQEEGHWLYTPFATDALVFVVNEDNPVDNLTSEQVRKIYTGEITNWKDVGGDDAEIVLIGREAGSGTRDGFESITDTKDACQYRQELTSTGDVITTVSQNPNAIGYASLASIKDSVKALTVNGVAPTEATVKDGTYLVQRPFVLVTKEGVALSETAQKFFDFATSADAASIISAAGAVPVA